MKNYKLNPERFLFEDSFVSKQIPNDPDTIFKKPVIDVNGFQHYQAWETLPDWEYLGYTDGDSIKIRPNPDTYVIMLHHKEYGQCWFHVNKTIIQIAPDQDMSLEARFKRQRGE